MKLTIGMIVKNEERYLRRCLEALQPILTRMEAELIIADTGSTDNTCAIAREFTDNVFHFEWINDFAAARNAVLARAKGKWFLSLDADEIFADTAAIVSFFNSGEYKKYHSARWRERNYNDTVNGVYSDFFAGRMTEILPDTRFAGAIHEVLTPQCEPVKMLQCLVEHYGYVRETDDDMIGRKRDQYLAILKAELEKNPTNVKHHYDLSNLYMFANDADHALDHCNRGLKLAIEQQNIFVYPLFFNKACALYARGDFEDVLETAREYFDLCAKPMVFDIDMYRAVGNASFNTGDWAKCREAYESYLGVLAAYKAGRFKGPELAIYQENSTAPVVYHSSLHQLIAACVLSGEEEAARQHWHTFIEDGGDSAEALGRLINGTMVEMKKHGDFSNLVSLWHLMEEEGSLETLTEWLDAGLFDKDCRPAILQVLCALPGDSDFLRLIRLRQAWQAEDPGLAEAVSAFIADVHEWQPRYADVLYWCVCCRIDPAELAGKLDFLCLTENLANKHLHYPDLPQQVCRYVQENAAADSPLWRAMLCGIVLVSDTLAEAEALALFRAYTAAAAASAGDPADEALPKELRAGLLFHRAETAADTEAAGEHYRAALEQYPAITNNAKRFMADLQQRQYQQQNKQQTELEYYAGIVKGNIAGMLRVGKKKDALAMIAAYEQMFPNDPEVQVFKKAAE